MNDPTRALPLFRRTGMLLASLSGVVLAIYLAALAFVPPAPDPSVSIPLIAVLSLCLVFFILSARHESLNWLQPFILLVMTPLPMREYTASMFSLGSFVAAEILLYRLGFFERSKFIKFLISIAYFYLSEILIGISSGAHILEILLPIVFMTVFLAFLMIVYGDTWVIYLKEPKPILSLSGLKMTKKESEYLRLLLDGHSIKEIAIDTGVKESTVRNTLARVYRKFDVQDKSALMAKCENFVIKD